MVADFSLSFQLLCVFENGGVSNRSLSNGATVTKKVLYRCMCLRRSRLGHWHQLVFVCWVKFFGTIAEYVFLVMRDFVRRSRSTRFLCKPDKLSVRSSFTIATGMNYKD